MELTWNLKCVGLVDLSLQELQWLWHAVFLFRASAYTKVIEWLNWSKTRLLQHKLAKNPKARFFKLRFSSNMCTFSPAHSINLSNFTCFLSDPWNSIVLISWALNIHECSPSMLNGPSKKCFDSLAMQLEQSLNTIYSFRIGCWKQLFFFTVSERAKLWY